MIGIYIYIHLMRIYPKSLPEHIYLYTRTLAVSLYARLLHRKKIIVVCKESNIIPAKTKTLSKSKCQ